MKKLMWQSNDFPEWGGESSQPADLISSLGELISFLALRSHSDVDLKKKQNPGRRPNVRNWASDGLLYEASQEPGRCSLLWM